jgi:Helix-turn-helix domain
VSEYLTTAQVADNLQYSQDFVRTLIRRGSLAAFKADSSRNAPVRISAESVRAFVASRTLTPQQASAVRQLPRHRPKRSRFAGAWGIPA